MSFVISKHAYDQLKLRSISESLIWEILKTPGHVTRQDDKIIYQSIITEAGRQYLIRVFINDIKIPQFVYNSI